MDITHATHLTNTPAAYLASQRDTTQLTFMLKADM